MRYLWMALLLTACVDDVEFDGFLYPCSGGLCVEEGPRAPEVDVPDTPPDGGCLEEDTGDEEPESEMDAGDDEGSEDSEEQEDDNSSDDDSSSEDNCNPPHGNAHGWGKWKGKGPC